jgi:hypothetical protein
MESAADGDASGFENRGGSQGLGDRYLHPPPGKLSGTDEERGLNPPAPQGVESSILSASAMHTELNGRATPCRGEGRGFDSLRVRHGPQANEE